MVASVLELYPFTSPVSDLKHSERFESGAVIRRANTRSAGTRPFFLQQALTNSLT